jgi:hypothetical protein
MSFFQQKCRTLFFNSFSKQAKELDLRTWLWTFWSHITFRLTNVVIGRLPPRTCEINWRECRLAGFVPDLEQVRIRQLVQLIVDMSRWFEVTPFLSHAPLEVYVLLSKVLEDYQLDDFYTNLKDVAIEEARPDLVKFLIARQIPFYRRDLRRLNSFKEIFPYPKKNKLQQCEQLIQQCQNLITNEIFRQRVGYYHVEDYCDSDGEEPEVFYMDEGDEQM